MRFVLFKDKGGFYRWTLYATNGRKIADSGEGYVNKGDCLHGIALTTSTNSRSQFTFYRDASNNHRWRLLATNNRVIADSGEGYSTLLDCQHGADLVISTNSQTPVQDAAA